METRVSRLEGAHDGIKQSQSILVMAVMGLAGLFFALAGIMVTLQIFTYGHIDRVEAKVDALPALISEEFRAMRAEMSAQTAAIAGAITAAKAPAQPVPAPRPESPKP